jgi:hypothetical protein
MQTQLFEIYRAGLKSAADMMTATLESARRAQQQQLDALQSALDDQTKSVRELADVRSLDELMALQSRLAGTQLERTMDFWSRLWRAAGDNQLAIIGQAQTQLGQVREGIREVTEAAQHEQRAA